MGLLPHHRAFAAALGLSVAAHLGFAAALGTDAFVRVVEPRPMAVPEPPAPRPVRFQLVDTPAEAEADAPPRDSRFRSNRNTRAQDQAPAVDPALRDQPRIERRGDATDLRLTARAPAPAVPTLDPAPSAPLAPLPVTPPTQTPPRPVRPPDVLSQPEPAPTAPPTPPARTQDTPAAVRVTPPPQSPRKPQRVEKPEPLVRQLPKKDATQEQRQVEKLRREIAALLPGPDPRRGRPTLTIAETRELANARVQGEFSYGASQHYFGEYLLNVKAQVESHWLARLVSDYSEVRHSRVVIDFKIVGDGSIHGLHVFSTRGDEHIFPGLCLESITDSAPFPPVPYAQVGGVPPGLFDKPLNIRFAFQYN